ncbi:MAG: hypothetical protein KDC48_09040 [Planctomycetes bacterium]|nr:hypothetical protein [Planctomycetota bacterium]
MNTLHTLATLSALAGPLLAQNEPQTLPKVRIELGLGAGTLDHDTDGSNLDGDTSAGAFRLGFEAFGKSGLGGGVRYEAWTSKDDLFNDAGFNSTEGSTASLFAHLSYRLGDEDFAMPLRGGILLHNHHLEDQVTDQDTDFASVALLTEIAPEVFLSRGERVSWSLTGGLSLGAGLTRIDSDALANDYDSTTVFYGAELGTRVRIDAIELGLSFVARGHSMSESDTKGGLSVLAYDSTFTGVMLTVGAVF